MSWFSRFSRLGMVARTMGPRGSIPYLFGERARPRASGDGASETPRLYTLHPRGAKYPVYCRQGSSDRLAFSMVFVDEEYRIADDVPDPKVILDCGANVGYSAVYFLSKFPGARVISVEPDDRNVALLRMNTAPYGDRSTVLHSAIWPRPAKMVVSKGQYRDGREWSTQVFECGDGDSHDLDALDIGSIMEKYNIDKIDILKMDIEKAERAVFENVGPWIDRVNLFLVELHDEHCRIAFFKAMDHKKFAFSRSGELTSARRIVPV